MFAFSIRIYAFPLFFHAARCGIEVYIPRPNHKPSLTPPIPFKAYDY